jgi:hypothetical protein
MYFAFMSVNTALSPLRGVDDDVDDGAAELGDDVTRDFKSRGRRRSLEDFLFFEMPLRAAAAANRRGWAALSAARDAADWPEPHGSSATSCLRRVGIGVWCNGVWC